jgi:hypothetical protein
MLKASQFNAKIEQLLVNFSRESGIESQSVNSIEVNYEGFVGESHSGLTRASCARVLSQYQRGTEISNVRQITIISIEELDKIAQLLQLPYLKPEWLGANIVVSGIADFSLIPPSSRLISTSGVSIVVDMVNHPCRYVGDVINQHFPDKGKLFPKEAFHLRGVTGWVEKEGSLVCGESFQLHIPIQPVFPHL